MKRKYLHLALFLINLLCLKVEAQQQFFQGFEPGDNWGIIQGSSNISNDNGATYTPANQTIRSGSYFWKVNNSTDTLILESKNVTGLSNMKVVVRIASISTTTANGAENTDTVQIFAIINGVTPPQADATVIGATNSRWGYNATLVGTTTAGNPTTFASPQNGTSTNNYATIEILIPNGTSTVGLMIRGKNNSTNEIWAIDDIELIACPNVTITGPSSGCLGDTITFTSTHIGDWSTTNSNATIVTNANNTDTIRVVLTNGSSTGIVQSLLGCNFSKNINIFPKPNPPFVGPVAPICQGTSAILTANSANNTIHWYDSPTGSSIGTGNIFTTPPITQSGTVTFYVAAQNNAGCFSNRIPVNITVNPAPIKYQISSGTICSQDDAIISLDGSENDIEYELYIDGVATGQTVTGNGNPIDFIISNPVQGSQVTIEALDINTGCSTFSDTITLNLVSPPNDYYTFNIDTLIMCENDIANFSLSGSQIGVEYNVLVNGNFVGVSQMGTTQPLNFSLSGLQDGDIINIFALDTLTGCYADLTDEIYVVVNPKPEVVISENNGILSADSTSGTFVWYHNGNIISGQNQSTLNISQAGTGSGSYYLIYTNSFGCTDTSNTVNIIISSLGNLENIQIAIYPNPFTDYIIVNAPLPIHIRLVNVMGQELENQNLEAGKHSIELKHLPSGIYFMEWKYESYKGVTKLVKN